MVALVVCFVLSCQKEPETIAVTGVMLSQTSVELTEGESIRLAATVSPGNATDKTIIWSSDNETVATVSSAGDVVAKVPGIANISVKTHDGGMTATCRVTVVSKKISVSGVSLDNATLSMIEGETRTLKAAVTPEDATDKSVTWSSDNTSVADVTSTGVVVAKTPGTATITVKTNDGGKTATCSVTVDSKVISIYGVSISDYYLTMTEGDTYALTATVMPKDATDKTVTWSSSDTDVATVSSEGLVTARSEGSAEITVKTNDGGKTATCSVTVKAKVIPVAGISLDISSVTLNVGQTQALTATVSPDNATDKTVTWNSSNVVVASVSSEGVVRAVSAGTATISATAGNFTADCSVTVVMSVASVSLNKTELTIEKGKSETLTATVSPSDATDKTVTWQSSNNAIATVDQNGRVTAVNAGSAVITVTTKDGSKTATCNVTVVIPVASVSLNKTELTIEKGKSETLTSTVSPSDATDKTVSWKSSNTSVVTVDQNGRVTAVGAGSAVITVTTKDGSKTATCNVTVVIPVTSVSLNKTELTIEKGKSETLTAIVSPSDATDKTVSWKSSNTSVVTVDQNGRVTAVNAGSAVITVTTNDGSKTATCKVTVVIPVTSVSLNKTELTIEKGKSETLTATVSPSDATNKTVSWKSSNTSVATVDQNGKVTAVGAGSAVITVTTKDGSKTATCKVTVVIPVTSVSLNKTELTIEKGKSETLTATVNPSDATNKAVTWQSSNTAIATVDQNGKVTAKELGNVTITVTTKDGSKTASCSVTVKRPANTEPIGDDGGEHGWD